MSTSFLLSHTEGAVRTLTLNRPEKRNALHPLLVEELTAAMGEADRDPSIRVIVLRGAGRAFCAGADLATLEQLQRNSPLENAEDSLRLRDLFHALVFCDTPTIACVHGPALAGGCGLALACDLVLASTAARFGFTEVRIGFVPAIILKIVVQRIGEGRARELFLRGSRIDALSAERFGLVNAVTEPESLDALCAAWAEEFATSISPTSVAMTKQLFRDTATLSLQEALRFGARMNALSRTTEDFRAGVASFLNRGAESS